MKVRGLPLAWMCACALLVYGCMDEKPSRPIEEVRALKGKTTQEVLARLGEPRVVDTTASPREQIWGYYQMMVIDESETTPRQRTVLIIFRKEGGEFRAVEVKIP